MGATVALGPRSGGIGDFGTGDAIEEPSFGELERELKLIESCTDAWVRESADGLAELIGMARREKSPIVFV